jgi:hypothetical protein
MLKYVLLACGLFSSNQLNAQYASILNDPDVIWAAEIELTFWIEPEFTAPDSVDSQSNYSTLLKLANQAVKPGDESQILLATRLLKLLSDEQKQVFAHPDSLRPLSMQERNRILNTTDTVSVFDPETYEEKLRVIDNSILGEDIMKLRLVEDWFWDEHRKTLQFQLYAFAPMATKYDNEANFMFNVPIFWRLIKD